MYDKSSHRCDIVREKREREKERKRDVARRLHKQLMTDDNAESIDIDPYKKKIKKEKQTTKRKKKRRKRKK